MPRNNDIRTSQGLCDSLFDEIDALRSGDSTPARARAHAALTHQILQSVRLEIDAQRMHAEYGDDVALPGISPIRLGKK